MNRKHFRLDRVALAIVVATAIAVMQPGRADTFTNPTPIMIPATDTGATTGAPAAPYPSVITVAGIPENHVISGVTVTLLDFTHEFPDDVDVLLVGPNGVRALLMSDVGAHFAVAGIDLTFDDDAGPLPNATLIGPGTYSPTNHGAPDTFPTPAPAAPYGSMLAAFVNLQPNGAWSLYVVDDAEFDVGTIGGGWSLDLTTVATTCGNGAIETGEDCDDSNILPGDGCGPTCLFEVCGNGFVDPGEACDDGNTTSGDGCTATCVAEFCGDGIIQAGINEACDDGNTLPGDGCGPTCLFEVCGNGFVDPGEDCDDGNTVACDGCDACAVVGPPFCNQTPIMIPAPPGTFSPAPAEPYPSVISVTGIPDGHVVSGLTVTVMDFSHSHPDDVDLLLVGPDGTNAFLMSDVGGDADVAGIDLTFADGAGQLPDNTLIAAGTYAPTNSGTPDQQFPAPAPAEPYGSTLSAFIGSNPNGNWNLYVVDDLANFENGMFALGWTLNLTTAFAQCGNGAVEPGEGCDDGNLTGGDGCSPMCNPEICGNGIVDPDETCDDANMVACDGCHNCAVEAPALCGNGVTECGEDCDDANADETDGCLSDCAQGAAIPPPPPGCCLTRQVCNNAFYPNSRTELISPVGTPTVTSTITVDGAETYLWDVNLTIQITHTASDNLDIALGSPAGTWVTISTDNGGANNDVFNGTVFDDQADPGNEVPYLPGSSNLVTDTLYANGVRKKFLTPEEPLSAFNGENPNGPWTLIFSDDSDFDGGDFLGWGLSITALPEAPSNVVETTASSAPGLAIGPGQGTVTDTITIDGASGGAITEVIVYTDVTHTQNADINMTLTHNGKSATLVSNIGGPNDDAFAGTTWRDDADPDNPVPYPQPNPFSNLVTDTVYTNNVVGTPRVPKESLALFNGLDPDGAWTITIFDDAFLNSGTLRSWSVTVTASSCEDELSGDIDEDGDVDLKDIQLFKNCFGQEVSPGTECASFDFDNDGDVDGADYQVMLHNFRGPGV